MTKMERVYVPAMTRIWPWNVPGGITCFKALTHDLPANAENVKNFMYMAYKGQGFAEHVWLMCCVCNVCVVVWQHHAARPYVFFFVCEWFENFCCRLRFQTQLGLLRSLCTALLACTEERRLPERCRDAPLARTSSAVAIGVLSLSY